MPTMGFIQVKTYRQRMIIESNSEYGEIIMYYFGQD